MANILDDVNLSVTGSFAAIDYNQRPNLQEVWESGAHEAVETLDCANTVSNGLNRNLLGSVWVNRQRGSGISRVIPKSYLPLKGVQGFRTPSVTTDISPVSASSGYAPCGYFRPWYAYRTELASIDGVPIQYQSTTSAVTAGDMRWIGQSPTSLTANQIAGTDPVDDGRRAVNVHYKPFRFMVMSDDDQNTIWSANADTQYTELHRYVTRDYSFASRNLTLPPNWLYWASDLNAVTGAVTADKVPIPEGATKAFPVVNLLYTWHDIPWYPEAAIQNCIGKVNAITSTTVANPDGKWDYHPSLDATNMPLRTLNGYAPGTLLFDGVHSLLEHTNAAGQWVCTITYSFIYRATGWNKFLRFETNAFESVVTKKSIGKAQANWEYLYDSASFNSLFQLPIV